MALANTNVGQNPQIPYAQAESFIPDQLIASYSPPPVTETATITGADLVRGTVLGKITLGAATSAAKSGGNTGNGTFVLDATTPILANAQPGVYQIRFVTTTSISVTAPDGDVTGIYPITATNTSTSTISSQIKGVVTEGATTFVAGDGFDVTIAAGSGKYKKSVATAVDGSQYPAGILVDAAAASGGDVLSGVYVMGSFNQNALTYDASWSVATLKPALRPFGIFLQNASLASDPS